MKKCLFVLISIFLIGSPLIHSETLKILELTPILGKFRLSACVDPWKAFEQYSSSVANQRFKEIGKILCPISDSKSGWQFFFGTSVSAVNALNEETILTLFYNPWSDVALITEWKKQENKPICTDAELVTGDILRNNKNPILTPLWRREGTAPPPLEVIVATSRTMKDFLKLYVNAHKSKNPTEWRSRLPNFSTEKEIKGNEMAVGVLFGQALAAMHVFFTEKDFAPVKSQMAQVRALLIEGKIDELLALAKDTTKENQDVLRKIPLEWDRATLISVAKNSKNTFVFLSSFENPEYFASFWFKDGSKEPSISRIDCMGHTLTFEQIDAIVKKAGIAKK
ncbi:MAG: hypothetical protein ACOY3I_07510 [Verrucomicrobiota bacterium]